MKNCIKLFLCSICFVFISDVIFGVTLSEGNFDQIFNESYNDWCKSPDDWKILQENNDQKELTLNVYLNEKEINFLSKLFPNINILNIHINKKNIFDHSCSFSFFEWDDEDIDCFHNNNQSEFTYSQIQKLIKTYPLITTFKIYQKDNIQLWLECLPLLKKLTHLTIKTNAISDQHLYALSALKLTFLKIICKSKNMNQAILNKIKCKKEIIIK